MNPLEFLKNFNMDDLKRKSEEMMTLMKGMSVTGEAGGGFVKVTINGEFSITNIEYTNSEFINSDLNMFRDLIILAQNNAVEKMKDELKGKFAGSMVPGLF